LTVDGVSGGPHDQLVQVVLGPGLTQDRGVSLSRDSPHLTLDGAGHERRAAARHAVGHSVVQELHHLVRESDGDLNAHVSSLVAASRIGMLALGRPRRI
jgi:hypothetical protein